MSSNLSNTRTELVEQWQRSLSVMHIAHILAASRYSNWHNLLGGGAVVLSTIVGTSIFASMLGTATKTGPLFVTALGLVSMLSAALSAAATFFHLDKRAQKHMETAANFQRLRREMEEELVKIAEGTPSESYAAFEDRWQRTLEASPSLPQKIHDRVKQNINTMRKE